MQPAGWYPDPSGQPDQFRFWDGHAWTPVVTRDANAPLPTPEQVQRAMGGHAPGTAPLGSGVPGQPGGAPGAPGASEPGGSSGQGSGGSKMPIVLGAVAGALVLVLALVIFVLRPGSDPEEPDDPNTPIVGPHPAGTATPPTDPGGDGENSGEDGPIRCDQGNQTAVPVQKGAESETAGMIFTLPDDYGFRLSADYFPYLNDYIAYAPSDASDRNRAVVAGGLPTEAGFGDRKQASSDLFQCIQTGFDSGAGFEQFEIGDSTEEQLGEFQATKTTAVGNYTDGSREEWTVYIVDTGQQGSWGVFMTFHAEGDDTAADEVQQIVDTVR